MHLYALTSSLAYHYSVSEGSKDSIVERGCSPSVLASGMGYESFVLLPRSARSLPFPSDYLS